MHNAKLALIVLTNMKYIIFFENTLLSLKLHILADTTCRIVIECDNQISNIYTYLLIQYSELTFI